MDMDVLLKVDEVADILAVDQVTVRRLVNRGELPAFQIGAEYRFRRDELADFIERQRVVGIPTGLDEPAPRHIAQRYFQMLSEETGRELVSDLAHEKAEFYRRGWWTDPQRSEKLNELAEAIRAGRRPDDPVMVDLITLYGSHLANQEDYFSGRIDSKGRPGGKPIARFVRKYAEYLRQFEQRHT